jgi:hypothetical protein
MLKNDYQLFFHIIFNNLRTPIILITTNTISISIAQPLKDLSIKIPNAEPSGKDSAKPNTSPVSKPIMIPSINMAIAPFKESLLIYFKYSIYSVKI